MFYKSISLVPSTMPVDLAGSALEMYVDSFHLQILQTQQAIILMHFLRPSSVPPPHSSHGHYLEGLAPRDYPHQYFPPSLSPMFPSTATLLTTLATVEHRRFAAGSTISATSLSESTIYCHVGSVQQSHSRSAQAGSLPELCHLHVASFPGRSRLQFLIAYCMQKRRGKAWEKESRA